MAISSQTRGNAAESGTNMVVIDLLTTYLINHSFGHTHRGLASVSIPVVDHRSCAQSLLIGFLEITLRSATITL